MSRVALVTGGSRGIGRGIVLSLAHAGHDVVVNYAGNVDAAKETVTEVESLGRRALPIQPTSRSPPTAHDSSTRRTPPSAASIFWSATPASRPKSAPTSWKPTRNPSTASSASTSKAPTS